jgi:hypothetical protein
LGSSTQKRGDVVTRNNMNLRCGQLLFDVPMEIGGNFIRVSPAGEKLLPYSLAMVG